jgi:hypothetical protein
MGQRDGSIGTASSAAAWRLAVVILASVTSGAEKVPTGGELTLFEAVGPAGLTSFVVSLVAGRGCPA